MFTKGYAYVLIGLCLMVGLISVCGGKADVDSGTPQAQEQQGQLEAPITRVVTLDARFTDYLVALDLVPVGATVRIGGGFESYLSTFLADTRSVGQSVTPNLETILSLQPQLIIGTDKDHMKTEEPLSLIAPTVILGNEGMETDWRAAFKQVAEVVGRAAQADEVLQAFEERVADLADQLAGEQLDRTVVFVRVSNKDVRILGNLSPLGQLVYGQLGLAYPAQLEDEEEETVLSIETMSELNPDFIFVMNEDMQDAQTLADLAESPVWRGLDAVKTGAYASVVMPADKAVLGPMMLELFLDDLEKVLRGDL